MEYFLEVFENIPRQGPGSNRYTKKAFDMIKGYLPEHPKILDIGCGKGAQSFKLAEVSNGHITCIDNHQPFVDFVNQKAKEEYIEDMIVAKLGDMNKLDLPEGRFDVVWSEGAIYNMGFEKGLTELPKYLKSMGFIVVSEAVWLKDNPPAEVKKMWDNEYADITSIDEKVAVVERCNLKMIAHYTLPEDGWLNFFYEPLQIKLNEFKEKNKGNKDAQAEYTDIQNEIDVYHKYKDYYSYEFFVMKKS
jgi:ubiquinone/menaquinone biosynthesis C-methylase UbiE